jgi:hypothetical protein
MAKLPCLLLSPRIPAYVSLPAAPQIGTQLPVSDSNKICTLGEFSCDLQVMWQGILEATQCSLETTRQDEIQLVAVDTLRRSTCGGSVGTNWNKMKLLKFDGSMSWAVFNCKFESAADHNDWPPCEFTCQDRRPVCWRCGNSGHC